MAHKHNWERDYQIGENYDPETNSVSATFNCKCGNFKVVRNEIKEIKYGL